jgi:hypothetical protein
MGHRGQLPGSSGEQVTTLDADCLGIDHHEALRALWLGPIFVAKHLGVAVLVDH